MAVTFGLDLTSATSFAYNTDYSCYFITPLYQVGTAQLPFKFTALEFQLVRPLRTGEGIKVWYRDDLTADWTEVFTYAYASSDDAVTARNIVTELPYDIKPLEMLQLKIGIKGSSTTTPELKQIIIS